MGRHNIDYRGRKSRPGARDGTLGIAVWLKGLDHHDVQPKPIRRTTHHQVHRYTHSQG